MIPPPPAQLVAALIVEAAEHPAEMHQLADDVCEALSADLTGSDQGRAQAAAALVELLDYVDGRAAPTGPIR